MKKRTFVIRSSNNYDCWGRYDDTTYCIEDTEDEVYFSTDNKEHAELLCELLNKSKTFNIKD